MDSEIHIKLEVLDAEVLVSISLPFCYISGCKLFILRFLCFMKNIHQYQLA